MSSNRSWSKEIEPLIPEINRYLRHLFKPTRQPNTIKEGNLNTPPDSPQSSPSNSDIESEQHMENKPLFRQFGTPGNYEPQGGIKLPTTVTNYQIHPKNTRTVREEVFFGIKNDCPLKHLEKFIELCDLMPVCTDNPDYVMMHLFRSNLAGDIKDWYKCLKPDFVQDPSKPSESTY